MKTLIACLTLLFTPQLFAESDFTIAFKVKPNFHPTNPSELTSGQVLRFETTQSVSGLLRCEDFLGKSYFTLVIGRGFGNKIYKVTEVASTQICLHKLTQLLQQLQSQLLTIKISYDDGGGFSLSAVKSLSAH